MEADEGEFPRSMAVITCTSMAIFYVAVLYSPTFILRLPQPSSYKQLLIRRFICAAVSSLVSIVVCALLLPMESLAMSNIFGVYGIRMDHTWQAVVFPIFLTSLMYAGSLALKFMLFVDSWKEHMNQRGGFSFNFRSDTPKELYGWLLLRASNILFWRNYVMAPLTEELVFRACMIPLLLCEGFKTYKVIFYCPIFFSLAHLSHSLEHYSKQNSNLLKTFLVVGLQLGYTVIFGSYASFLFIRTGHLVAPLGVHIFCNYMGLPVLFSEKKGVVFVAFVAGLVAFARFLLPLTRPELYNERTDDCSCWHRYCSWD